MIRECLCARCRCGHEAPMEMFLVDEDGRDLPLNHYRCPACGYKFHRVTTPGREYRFQGERRWIPPQTTIQRTPEPWEGYGSLTRVMEMQA